MRLPVRWPATGSAIWIIALAAAFAPAAEFRNFSLPCLAPLLDKVDSEAPDHVGLAFLRGPSRAPRPGGAIGAVAFPITTGSPEAATFFNRGVAFLHGLSNAEAERSFRQALVHDPHHPMVYWGLAVANEQRPGRARLFTQNAVRRVRNDTTPRERQWIDTLAHFYNIRRDGPAKLPPPEVLTDEEVRERHRGRIRDLEGLTLAFPDDVEAKAFLLRSLTLDEHRFGIPITSHVAVDLLARELAELAPAHPSRHYQVFLWLAERPAMALEPAKVSAGLAPGLPDSWRYAAEAWRANGRHHHAVALLEAALRVHHREMREHLLMPEDSETLLSNYAALIETLGATGRIDDALDRAGELLSLPRKLSPEKDAAATSSLSSVGKRLFVTTLLRAEFHEVLLAELDGNPLLQPGRGSPLDRARGLYWKAVAQLALGRLEEADALREQLATLAESAGAATEREQIEALRTGIETLRTLHLGKVPAAAPGGLPELPLSVVARAWAKAGRPDEALELARRNLDGRPGDVLATATYCELHVAAGQLVPAMSAFTRVFRESASRADAGLPVLERLHPLAEKMRLPNRWQLPATKPEVPGAPADPAALGPDAWEPAAAPAWSLPNHAGRSIALADFAGKPVLLNFFLGVDCPYCVNQLNRFRPHLDSFAAAGIGMVAISNDSVASLAKRLGDTEEKTAEARQTFPYPVLADPDLSAFKAFGAFDDFEGGPMHATFLIGPGGRVLWSDVSHGPFNHPELLLEEARRLLGG